MSSRLERWWYPTAAPGLARSAALAPLVFPELLFRAGVATRGALYRIGVFRPAVIAGATVISVGNLTVGGAGKTPVVIELARRLTRLGRRVAVVTRGYGRRSRTVHAFDSTTALAADEVGDEPLLIARRSPGVTVWVGPDKAELARRARDESGADTILVDDGFQTRRLGRDVEIVVVDAAAGFGNGHLLPRGPLREPPSALERAHLLWVKGEGPFDPAARAHVRAAHAPSAWVRPDATVAPLAALRGAPVFAFCGIARPDGFFRAVESLGARLVGARAFPDHHRFETQDLDALAGGARSLGATLVTTEKDQVRLPAGMPAWALRLEVTVTAGEDRLAALLGPARAL